MSQINPLVGLTRPLENSSSISTEASPLQSKFDYNNPNQQKQTFPVVKNKRNRLGDNQEEKKKSKRNQTNGKVKIKRKDKTVEREKPSKQASVEMSEENEQQKPNSKEKSDVIDYGNLSLEDDTQVDTDINNPLCHQTTIIPMKNNNYHSHLRKNKKDSPKNNLLDEISKHSQEIRLFLRETHSGHVAHYGHSIVPLQKDSSIISEKRSKNPPSDEANKNEDMKNCENSDESSFQNKNYVRTTSARSDACPQKKGCTISFISIKILLLALFCFSVVFISDLPMYAIIREYNKKLFMKSAEYFQAYALEVINGDIDEFIVSLYSIVDLEANEAKIMKNNIYSYSRVWENITNRLKGPGNKQYTAVEVFGDDEEGKLGKSPFSSLLLYSHRLQIFNETGVYIESPFDFFGTPPYPGIRVPISEVLKDHTFLNYSNYFMGVWKGRNKNTRAKSLAEFTLEDISHLHIDGWIAPNIRRLSKKLVCDESSGEGNVRPPLSQHTDAVGHTIRSGKFRYSTITELAIFYDTTDHFVGVRCGGTNHSPYSSEKSHFVAFAAFTRNVRKYAENVLPSAKARVESLEYWEWNFTKNGITRDALQAGELLTHGTMMKDPNYIQQLKSTQISRSKMVFANPLTPGDITKTNNIRRESIRFNTAQKDFTLRVAPIMYSDDSKLKQNEVNIGINLLGIVVGVLDISAEHICRILRQKVQTRLKSIMSEDEIEMIIFDREKSLIATSDDIYDSIFFGNPKNTSKNAQSTILSLMDYDKKDIKPKQEWDDKENTKLGEEISNSKIVETRGTEMVWKSLRDRYGAKLIDELESRFPLDVKSETGLYIPDLHINASKEQKLTTSLIGNNVLSTLDSPEWNVFAVTILNLEKFAIKRQKKYIEFNIKLLGMTITIIVLFTFMVLLLLWPILQMSASARYWKCESRQGDIMSTTQPKNTEEDPSLENEQVDQKSKNHISDCEHDNDHVEGMKFHNETSGPCKVTIEDENLCAQQKLTEYSSKTTDGGHIQKDLESCNNTFSSGYTEESTMKALTKKKWKKMGNCFSLYTPLCLEVYKVKDAYLSLTDAVKVNEDKLKELSDICHELNGRKPNSGKDGDYYGEDDSENSSKQTTRGYSPITEREPVINYYCVGGNVSTQDYSITSTNMDTNMELVNTSIQDNMKSSTSISNTPEKNVSKFVEGTTNRLPLGVPSYLAPALKLNKIIQTTAVILTINLRASTVSSAKRERLMHLLRLEEQQWDESEISIPPVDKIENFPKSSHLSFKEQETLFTKMQQDVMLLVAKEHYIIQDIVKRVLPHYHAELVEIKDTSLVCAFAANRGDGVTYTHAELKSMAVHCLDFILQRYVKQDFKRRVKHESVEKGDVVTESGISGRDYREYNMNMEILQKYHMTHASAQSGSGVIPVRSLCGNGNTNISSKTLCKNASGNNDSYTSINTDHGLEIYKKYPGSESLLPTTCPSISMNVPLQSLNRKPFPSSDLFIKAFGSSQHHKNNGTSTISVELPPSPYQLSESKNILAALDLSTNCYRSMLGSEGHNRHVIFGDGFEKCRKISTFQSSAFSYIPIVCSNEFASFVAPESVGLSNKTDDSISERVSNNGGSTCQSSVVGENNVSYLCPYHAHTSRTLRSNATTPMNSSDDLKSADQKLQHKHVTGEDTIGCASVGESKSSMSLLSKAHMTIQCVKCEAQQPPDSSHLSYAIVNDIVTVPIDIMQHKNTIGITKIETTVIHAVLTPISITLTEQFLRRGDQINDSANGVFRGVPVVSSSYPLQSNDIISRLRLMKVGGDNIERCEFLENILVNARDSNKNPTVTQVLNCSVGCSAQHILVGLQQMPLLLDHSSATAQQKIHRPNFTPQCCPIVEFYKILGDMAAGNIEEARDRALKIIAFSECVRDITMTSSETVIDSFGTTVPNSTHPYSNNGSVTPNSRNNSFSSISNGVRSAKGDLSEQLTDPMQLDDQASSMWCGNGDTPMTRIAVTLEKNQKRCSNDQEVNDSTNNDNIVPAAKLPTHLLVPIPSLLLRRLRQIIYTCEKLEVKQKRVDTSMSGKSSDGMILSSHWRDPIVVLPTAHLKPTKSVDGVVYLTGKESHRGDCETPAIISKSFDLFSSRNVTHVPYSMSPVSHVSNIIHLHIKELQAGGYRKKELFGWEDTEMMHVFDNESMRQRFHDENSSQDLGSSLIRFADEVVAREEMILSRPSGLESTIDDNIEIDVISVRGHTSHLVTSPSGHTLTGELGTTQTFTNEALLEGTANNPIGQYEGLNLLPSFSLTDKPIRNGSKETDDIPLSDYLYIPIPSGEIDTAKPSPLISSISHPIINQALKFEPVKESKKMGKCEECDDEYEEVEVEVTDSDENTDQ